MGDNMKRLTDLVLDLVVMVLFGVALGATIFFNL